jgi:hypothetical protein
MDKINLFKDALPNQLFRRLARAVQAVGTERMENMGSYNTTFWFPIGAKPTNIVEQCVSKLYTLVRPGSKCIGMEWWLGRLKFGEELPFHTDRDRSLRHETGQIVHPLWSSILYLNRFPSSPTVVLDQVLSPDGKSWIPPEANSGRSLDAVPNHYVAFRGDLRHGVVANGAGQKKASRSGDTQKSPELRLTLLVNYWDRRPAPPNCQDYDGTVYRSIQDEGISPTAGSRRLSAA